MVDVLVLHSKLAGDSDAVRLGALLDRLPYARRLELGRRDPVSRAASLAGTALVLAGAARLRGAPVDPARLGFPAGGAPLLQGGPWFSVSHSATRVAVALSDDGPVGLDLEDAEAESAVAGTFAATLERWTAMEAALKAVGARLDRLREVRLADDLSVAEVGGVALSLRALDLGTGCTACLATQGAFRSVTVRRIADPG